MSSNGFEVIRKLGEGAYSNVYKVHRQSDSTDYAMKSIKMGNLSMKEQENAVNEVRFLASLSCCPEIIAYKEAFYEEKSGVLQIIMEYCAGGDLLNKTKKLKKKNQYLDEKVIWLYILQMTRGLRKLHEFNIVHRDFKCANVMLNREHTQLKLGDLNVSKVAKHGGLLYTQTGTPYYASPEIWKDKPYDAKSDVWSLGCVIYELVTLSPPFKANDMEGLYKKVQKGVYDAIPSWYSQDLSDYITKCLQVNPRSRPSTSELLESQLLAKRYNIAAELNIKLGDITVTAMTVKQDLLKTLKIGKNLHALNSMLPESQYDSTAASTPERNNIGEIIHTSLQPPPAASSSKPIVSDQEKKASIRPMTNDIASSYIMNQQKRHQSLKTINSQSVLLNNNQTKSLNQSEAAAINPDAFDMQNNKKTPQQNYNKVHRSMSIEANCQPKSSNAQLPIILPPISEGRKSSLNIIKDRQNSNIFIPPQHSRVSSGYRIPSNYLRNHDQQDFSTPHPYISRNLSQGSIPQSSILPSIPVLRSRVTDRSKKAY